MIKLRSLYILTFTHKRSNVHKAYHEGNIYFPSVGILIAIHRRKLGGYPYWRFSQLVACRKQDFGIYARLVLMKGYNLFRVLEVRLFQY